MSIAAKGTGPEIKSKRRSIKRNRVTKARATRRSSVIENTDPSPQVAIESESDQAKQRQPRPALEYQVTHIKEVMSVPQLLWTRLPVREAANRKINMLYDSGSIISLIKLKQLRDDALIYENKIALTGITGHKVYTIGKTPRLNWTDAV